MTITQGGNIVRSYWCWLPAGKQYYRTAYESLHAIMWAMVVEIEGGQ